VIFKGYEGRGTVGVVLDYFEIKRLDESWIDDCR